MNFELKIVVLKQYLGPFVQHLNQLRLQELVDMFFIISVLYEGKMIHQELF